MTTTLPKSALAVASLSIAGDGFGPSGVNGGASGKCAGLSEHAENANSALADKSARNRADFVT